MSKKNSLDQYYTAPQYAKHCYDLVKSVVEISNYTLCEPCVGTGSFFNIFEGEKFGFDLDPKVCHEDVTVSDFLEVKSLGTDKTIVISNPPFGYASSIAVKFFNKCASFENVDYICFIVPKTFMKNSIINKLDTSFHLMFFEESPKNSFILHGKSYNVPCVFQIWKRSSEKRQIKNTISSCEYFSFCDKSDAHFCIRRVGGKSGQLLEGTDHNTNSTYFIKFEESNYKEKILKILKSDEYLDDIKQLRTLTAGVNSLSKSELIYTILKYIEV